MKRFLLLTVLTVTSFISFAQTNNSSNDSLYKNFLTPPDAAKPRVWWHWMNGNITKDGIRKDLEWMHRSGIGGFQNFDAGLTTPQIVNKRLTFMTPEWKDAFRFATQLADSLQLEMAIAGSPGWSESGGPWVPAKDGMKKLVWSEVRVQGGQAFNNKLPQPPTTTGTFQNVHLTSELSGLTGATPPPPEYYQDVAVVAYRLPAADVTLKDLHATVSSSGGSFTVDQLTDGDLATTSLLPSDTVKGYAWIQYAFPQPQTIKAITVVGGGTRSVFGVTGQSENRSLEASDDGVNFHRICFVPLSVVAQQTITIPVTTAKYFRITFKNPPPPFSFAALNSGTVLKPPPGNDITEIVLYPVTRINHFEEKSRLCNSN